MGNEAFSKQTPTPSCSLQMIENVSEHTFASGSVEDDILFCRQLIIECHHSGTVSTNAKSLLAFPNGV